MYYLLYTGNRIPKEFGIWEVLNFNNYNEILNMKCIYLSTKPHLLKKPWYMNVKTYPGNDCIIITKDQLEELLFLENL